MAFLGASSSSTGPWKYDVFLSFRGIDTRNNFIAHLHRALSQSGITIFIDDDELKRGEEISPALHQAIEQSRISIVVFSQNYASSGWCLNGLLKIRDCKETNGQMVLPVFYKVNPSDVRHQKNSFEGAFATHEERFKDDIKVQNWKAALTQVANLSGLDLEHCRNEAQFIDKIVQDVSRIVNHTYFQVAKHPVGLESRVREINSLLSIDQMNDIRMVGILGAGGIGKTTIAKAIYNLIASQFEGDCFLANVRETSKQCLGLVQLQSTLLSKILGHTVKVDNVDEGIIMIKKGLCSKRVLVILDDVDDELDQLDKLAGKVDWFGLGSRIIITTRDRKVLTNHGRVVDDLIYKVKELDWDKASELFCWNAFHRDQPTDDFLEVTKDAIYYAWGLPLALEVLGSHLYGEDIHKWRSVLEKYKRIPHVKIRERLRISYDGLHEDEQNIFLDIACFFRGKSADYVKTILASSDCFPDASIPVLIRKSLITIDGSGCLAMHDLLQDMGREVVRKESPIPGERSRLWFHKDVLHILENDTGTNKIQGILVDLPKGEEDMVDLSSKAFENMRSLRLLMVNPNALFSTGPNFLPNTLRVLDWPNCPLESLPPKFRGRNLSILKMDRSLLKELKGIENFRSTTIMDFSDCVFLKIFPDVSNCQNLEELVLNGCVNLAKVHDSVGLLEKLVFLSLEKCYNLIRFPRMLNLKSLKYLSAKDCSRLKYFPNVSSSPNLEYLALDGCINLAKVHDSVGLLEELVCLSLNQCYKLSHFPRMLNLKSLKHLSAKDCSRLEYFPNVSRSPNLEYLALDGCINLAKVHDSVGLLEKLASLRLELSYTLSRFLRRLGIESLVRVAHLTSLRWNGYFLPVSRSGNGEQGSNSSISSQGVILFLIGSMIGLLQLHDLFETHPANMWISEAALVIFCLSYAAVTKINGTPWARYSQIIDGFRVLSGTLLLVSLSSIQLPHQLSWLFYIIWAFLVFIVVAFTGIYPQGGSREA